MELVVFPERFQDQVCESIIEAGWLLSLVVIPLFFNPFSNRSFEPDKAAVLKVIVLVMSAAWLTKVVLGGRPWRSFAGASATRPSVISARIVLLPTTAFLACITVSSLLSVEPRLSFFGTYQRAQGELTTLLYVVLFLFTAGHLRDEPQWQRLRSAVILTSLPVSLYALMQGLHTDPLTWAGGIARSSSTLGNPIFLGGYLVFAFFVTLRELVLQFSPPAGHAPATRRVIHAGLLLYVLTMQVIAVVRSGSRGPVLGIVLGLAVYALLALPRLQTTSGGRTVQPRSFPRTRRWIWPVVVGFAVCGLLLVLASPRIMAPVFQTPDSSLTRVARVFDLQSRTAQVRINLWTGVKQMIRAGDPFEINQGEPDSLHSKRLLVGYGPETLQLTLSRFLPESLLRLEKKGSRPDRAHNDVLDRLATTGVLGVICWLWLVCAILGCAAGGLGLLRTRRHATLFVCVAAVLIGVGLILPWLLTGNAIWSAVAMPTVLILGLAVCGAIVRRIKPSTELEVPAVGQHESLIIALVAAIAAHLVETSFAFPITTTSLYFWFFAAALVVAGSSPPGPTRSDANDTAPAGPSASAIGLLTGILCATLVFGFAVPTGHGAVGFMSGGWRLIGLTWMAALLLVTTAGAERRRAPLTRIILPFAATSILPTLIFTVAHRAALDRALQAFGSGSSLANAVGTLTALIVGFVWCLLAVQVLIGITLFPGGARVPRSRRQAATCAVLAIMLICTAIGAPTLVRTVRADGWIKFALHQLDQDRPRQSLELVRRAVQLAPHEASYLGVLGKAAAAVASRSTDADEIEEHRDLATRSLERAVALSPLDADNIANLARFQVVLGEQQSDTNARLQLYETAVAGFDRALWLRPRSVPFLRARGGVLQRLDRLEPAARSFEEALRLEGELRDSSWASD